MRLDLGGRFSGGRYRAGRGLGRGCGGAEELLSQRLEPGGGPSTPESEVADLVELLGPDMEEESSEELMSLEFGDTASPEVWVVVVEDDVGLGDVEDSVLVQ
jgi:hypothetical protein